MLELEPPVLQGVRRGFQQLQQSSLTTNSNNRDNNSSQPSCSTLSSNREFLSKFHNSSNVLSKCHSNSSSRYHNKLHHNHRDSSPDNLSSALLLSNPDNLSLLLLNNPDNLRGRLFLSVSLQLSLNLLLPSSRGNPSLSVSSDLNQSELHCRHRLLLLQLIPETSRAPMCMILQETPPSAGLSCSNREKQQ